ILEDRALTHFDVGCYRHARRHLKIFWHVMQRHSLDRYARAVEGFTNCLRDRNRACWIAGLVLRRETARTDDFYGAFSHTILGIREGIELYRHRITNMYKAIVLSVDVGLDLKRRIGGHQGNELLT